MRNQRLKHLNGAPPTLPHDEFIERAKVDIADWFIPQAQGFLRLGGHLVAVAASNRWRNPPRMLEKWRSIERGVSHISIFWGHHVQVMLYELLSGAPAGWIIRRFGLFDQDGQVLTHALASTPLLCKDLKTAKLFAEVCNTPWPGLLSGLGFLHWEPAFAK
jgi:hypothetical protein